MKKILFAVSLLAILPAARAQDTTDVFTRHLNLEETVITGLTGDSRLSESSAAVSVLDAEALRSSASSNIIEAISRQPGVESLSTGSGISKPVIRGLGYNRVVVISDGIRQEGQQWGDEHGIETDGAGVHSAEIIKGPASLMYGSDALAGVVIFHPDPFPLNGTVSGGVSGEYQSCSGLAAYSLHQEGNLAGKVWSIRFCDKYAHAYRNAADGLVPGTQFRERAFTARAGINRKWGFSRVTLSYFHLTPGLAEGYEGGVLEGPVGYAAELPFQQVRHYKGVWDNSILTGRGRIRAVLGFQQNRRQEFEESADEAELDFRLSTLNYDIKYISGEMSGWKYAAGVGGMLQESGNLGEEVLIPAYRLLDAGAFATATRSVGRMHFSGGLRGDLRSLESFPLEGKFEGFGRTFPGITGSIGMAFSPYHNLNLRVNLARGFRAPNLSELASNGVHEGTVRYERGNSSLLPEYSLQGDIGADFSSEHFSATAALFCNRIDGYIFAEKTGASVEGYDEYRYTASAAVLYGGEAVIDVHPVHPLHVELRGALLRGTFSEGDMPLIPAPRLGAEIRWELFHGRGDFVALRFDHRFAQNHYLPGTETATPAYSLLGAAISTEIRFSGRRLATLSLIADNLTDAVYTDHLSRLKYTGIRNPGRNISVRLEVPIQ